MAAPVRLVTGYVRLDAHRPHSDYVALGNRLLSLPGPMTFFCDHPGWFACGPSVEVAPAGTLWLLDVVKGSVFLPATNNPTKDTLAYHAVQHQKTLWLLRAAARHPGDTLVWLDLGILHVPGITEDSIRRVAECTCLPGDAVTLASIWGPPGLSGIDPTRISWHCAGGVVACPSPLADGWHSDCVREAERLYRRSNRVTFEVNTWASVWQRSIAGFAHYRCDHNGSLLDGMFTLSSCV